MEVVSVEDYSDQVGASIIHASEWEYIEPRELAWEPVLRRALTRAKSDNPNFDDRRLAIFRHREAGTICVTYWLSHSQPARGITGAARALFNVRPGEEPMPWWAMAGAFRSGREQAATFLKSMEDKRRARDEEQGFQEEERASMRKHIERNLGTDSARAFDQMPWSAGELPG